MTVYKNLTSFGKVIGVKCLPMMYNNGSGQENSARSGCMCCGDRISAEEERYGTALEAIGRWGGTAGEPDK